MPLARLFRPAVFLVLTVLVGLMTGTAAAVAAPSDPLADGPYQVLRQRYEAGSITLQDPGSPGATPTNQSEAFTQYLRGDIHYPASGDGPFPVIVNVHGNHANCWDGVSLANGHVGTYRADQTNARECAFQAGSSAPAPAGYRPLPNDEGYDYIARNLASHGYLVISVDQDEMMAHQPGSDRGMYMRSQIIAAHLDALTMLQQGLPAGDLPRSLAGKIDLTRIGLQGHSRGGDAVTNFIDYNRTRPAPGRRYPLSAVLSIAPVDYERRAPYGVNYATVLPLCDGDVSNVQGARFFERSQEIAPDDPFPSIQFALHGTDHNYFNTSWVDDDDGSGYARDPTVADPSAGNARDLACGEGVQQVTPLTSPVPTSIRLTQADQRKTGLAIEAAFMRRYVGGETAFAPYMTGETGLPASACKAQGNPGVPCDQELSTNYYDAPQSRMSVLDPVTPDPLGTNALGGALSGSGFSNPYKDAAGHPVEIGTPVPADTPGGYDVCNPEPKDFIGTQANPPLAVKPCPLPPLDPPAGQATTGSQRTEREFAPVNRSYGNQLALAWDRPASLTAELPARNANVSGFKTLSLSAAVNYFDLRNEQRTVANASDPAAVTQDFDVVLTDADGKEATVAAGSPAYGNALQPSLGAEYSEGGQPHRGRRHILLEQVRIPTQDFEGVDLSRIRSVGFRFGARRATGSIELADVRFQEGVRMDAVPVVSAAPGQSAPAGTAVGDVSIAAPGTIPSATLAAQAAEIAAGAAVCEDRAAPRSRIAKIRISRSSVRISGRTRDTGCKGKVAPRRVYLSFTRAGRQAAYTRVKGRSVWSYVSKHRRTRGIYRLRIRATDAAGNLEEAVTRRLRIK